MQVRDSRPVQGLDFWIIQLLGAPATDKTRQAVCCVCLLSAKGTGTGRQGQERSGGGEERSGGTGSRCVVSSR